MTRDLLHRSEKVTLHRMMHGSIQLPVMPRGVGRVALIARSVGRVRVTRPIVARHIRQSITAVAMHAMARMTSAVATAVPVAAAVATAVAIATAITGVPIATAVTTAATEDWRVAVTAAPTESASRSRTSGRNCETHAEDCYR